MPNRVETDDGKLIAFERSNGETVYLEDLRTTLENANGNPQVIDVLDKIIDYLEQQQG